MTIIHVTLLHSRHLFTFQVIPNPAQLDLDMGLSLAILNIIREAFRKNPQSEICRSRKWHSLNASAQPCQTVMYCITFVIILHSGKILRQKVFLVFVLKCDESTHKWEADSIHKKVGEIQNQNNMYCISYVNGIFLSIVSVDILKFY
jgi:hypothetical protein